MPIVHYTLFFAGLCALLHFALSLLVVFRRGSAGVDLLDGGDAILLRRIRAHANHAEHAPLGVALLALMELSGTHAAWVLGLGTSLVAGRVLHAIGILTGGGGPGAPAWATQLRRIGTLLTLNALSISGAVCLWQFAAR